MDHKTFSQSLVANASKAYLLREQTNKEKFHSNFNKFSLNK
jgi:hypothetical protein